MNSELLTLFLILAVGLGIGRLPVLGMKLESSAVIFFAMLMGHYQFTVPESCGLLGLVLFIYCVGLAAGPRIGSVLAKHGFELVQMSLLIVVVSLVVCTIAGCWFKLPAGLVAGLYAGSLSSTPALAAATEYVSTAEQSLVSIGYGVAYPLGLFSMLAFVSFVPGIFGAKDKEETANSSLASRIIRLQVEVTNPNLYGKEIKAAAETLLMNLSFHVTRLYDGSRLVPIAPGMRFQEGQIVQVVGEARHLEHAIAMLGAPTSAVVPNTSDESDSERMRVIVTDPDFTGKTLSELRIFSRFVVTITRIERQGVTWAPSSSTMLQLADQLSVVGCPEQLRAFSKAVGHRERARYETDLFSLCFGVVLGIVLGGIPLGIGDQQPITLGLAGGPLVIALALGAFGRVGALVGRMPLAAQSLLRELGLILFLADAGVRAGADALPVISQYGQEIIIVSLLTTWSAMGIGFLVSRYFFKLEFWEALGGLCGGLTSTPSLGVVTARTDSEAPLSAYAAAYPVALLFVVVGVQGLLWLSELLL